LIQGSIDAALRQEFPGEYRSRRYSHWKAQYKKFCWEDVPDGVAARFSQLPNKYRAKGGVVKGPKTSKFNVPDKIESAVVNHIESLVEGENSCMQRSEHISGKDLQVTLGWICDQVNEAVKQESVEVKKRNQDLLAKYSRDEISLDDVLIAMEKAPQLIEAKSVRHVAGRFKKKHAYSKQSVNTAGNYLTFDDPVMEECLAWLNTIFCVL